MAKSINVAIFIKNIASPRFPYYVSNRGDTSPSHHFALCNVNPRKATASSNEYSLFNINFNLQKIKCQYFVLIKYSLC